ncbi:MAG: VOC family protein [Acidobacteria bacterium]|nr:VOC family protein [Acidobacteriota bacterium]
MTRRLLFVSGLVALLGLPGGAQAPRVLPYDHIHLAAADPDKAYAWYFEHLSGQDGENAGRMIFEPFTGRRPLPVQLMFIKAPEAPPSEGSIIASIGFSVADVEARVRRLEAAGARVVTPARDVPGLWTQAVVVDPFGITIELVDDRDHRGFHHITLRVPDVEASVRWFLAAFGGERTKLRGRLEALQYDHTFIVFQQGQGAPSEGRAIDHLGWTPRSIDALQADLTTKGVTFTTGPSPKPNQFGHRTGYVVAPGGARIELVEHAACKWGQVEGTR